MKVREIVAVVIDGASGGMLVRAIYYLSSSSLFSLSLSTSQIFSYPNPPEPASIVIS